MQPIIKNIIIKVSEQLLLQSVFLFPKYDELLELLLVLHGVFHEGVAHQLCRRPSIFRLLNQAQSHEVLKC